jgi:hypothetical protein
LVETSEAQCIMNELKEHVGFKTFPHRKELHMCQISFIPSS